MAYINFQPKDYFNTIKWDGDGSNPRTFTDVGFQPDMTTIKCRDSAQYFYCYDSVRTAGVSNEIIWNGTEAQGGAGGTTGYMSAFAANGFTVTAGSSNDNVVNDGALDYAAGSWKAGTTTGITQGGAAITPSAYSFNQTAGFSIIKYSGTLTGSGNTTVPHGLGVAPKMIIFKLLSGADNWAVQNTNLSAGYYLRLNTTMAQTDATGDGALPAPTSDYFYVNWKGEWGNSGSDYIAYCFADVKGYSKFNRYVGNGSSTNGPFIYTGFRPAWILLKGTQNTWDWNLYDNKRLGYNTANKVLQPNNSNAEATEDIDIYSNGFKIFDSGNRLNQSGYIYAYAAFAEFPLVSSNSKVGTAR